MDRLIVLSPHYDDAVLSCGQLLIGHHNPVVVTVFTQEPHNTHYLTEYDKNCGFTQTAEVIPARKLENESACRVVGADTWDLGVLDNQYARGADLTDEVRRVIAEVVKSSDRRDMFVAPLATKHPDHQKVMEAALILCRRHHRKLWLYEELPHRVEWPEEVEENRLRVIRDFDVELTLDFIGDGMIELKEAAVACYQSQLWALNKRHIFVPERFHQVKFL